MLEIVCETDITTCRDIWNTLVPPEKITDLWDVRSCFQSQFGRKPSFIIANENNKPVGLIPLSFLEESNSYGFFPGEVWHGKTWLEQNRIIAPDSNTLNLMFQWLEQNKMKYDLRYITPTSHLPVTSTHMDEIGYIFNPPAYHYDMEEYYMTFSNKTFKNIKREVNRFNERALKFRCGDLNDFEEMLTLNIERFGQESYFANNKFVNAFRALRDYLHQNNYLIMTAILIEDKVAAVDMGCIYKGCYTLLAGGTHSDFMGIAKVINLHHMQESCNNNYHSVDFLCGDFSWKKIFHLTPQPLFKLSNIERCANV